MWRPSRLKNLLLVILAAFAFSLSSVAQVGVCTTASCWTYSSPTGPSNWGGLTPYAYCTQSNAPTQQQSPINVTSPTVNTGLKLASNYAGVQVPVEDTGYTIEADYSPGSSQNTVTYGGKRYTLLQFHFHEKSEHTINGTGAPMEVHLVHKASDGTYLVIGVLINVAAEGGTNEGFHKVREAIESHNQPEQSIDPIQMIPGTANSSSLSFYTYTGSLTTPPCTPGITWIVMKDPIQISQTQFNWYKYTNSSRGVQPSISGLSLQSNFQP
jgi:carbonic anhydrase